MKRSILTFTIILFALTLSNAQVFHSAQTLKKGTFAIGLEPAIIVNGGDAFYLFIHGGYGVKSGIDMALKIGLGEWDNYIGGDLEFSLRKNISLTVGAHSFGNFGLDGALLFNIPIKSDVKLITGIDADIVFANDVEIPLWIPAGLEIYLKQKTALIFEAEIGLTDPAYHIFGGGVTFFF